MYVRIDVEEESFKESFEKTVPIGVTFTFPPYFKDESISSTNDKVTIRRRDDILHSRSRWGQKCFWQGMRGKEKSTEEGNNKVISESGGIRGKDFIGKGFMWKG